VDFTGAADFGWADSASAIVGKSDSGGAGERKGTVCGFAGTSAHEPKSDGRRIQSMAGATVAAAGCDAGAMGKAKRRSGGGENCARTRDEREGDGGRGEEIL